MHKQMFGIIQLAIQEDNWVDKLLKHCCRDPLVIIFLFKQKEYREKLESLMINEAMNGESAKIKSGYWYADLRNIPEKNG